MRRITTMAILALLMGGLTACGNDDSDDASLSFQTDADGNVVDDDSDTSGADPGPPDDSGDDIPDIGEGSGNGDSGGEGTGGSGAAGTMTIDGVEIGFDEVLRCEEDSTDLDDIERMLEIFYTGGDYRLELFTSDMANVGLSQSINVAGPDGRFNGGGVETANGWVDGVSGTSDEPPYELDGNRITGSGTLSADRDSDTLVEVSFDVVFPDDTTQCR